MSTMPRANRTSSSSNPEGSEWVSLVYEGASFEQAAFEHQSFLDSTILEAAFLHGPRRVLLKNNLAPRKVVKVDGTQLHLSTDQVVSLEDIVINYNDCKIPGSCDNIVFLEDLAYTPTKKVRTLIREHQYFLYAHEDLQYLVVVVKNHDGMLDCLFFKVTGNGEDIEIDKKSAMRRPVPIGSWRMKSVNKARRVNEGTKRKMKEALMKLTGMRDTRSSSFSISPLSDLLIRSLPVNAPPYCGGEHVEFLNVRRLPHYPFLSPFATPPFFVVGTVMVDDELEEDLVQVLIGEEEITVALSSGLLYPLGTAERLGVERAGGEGVELRGIHVDEWKPEGREKVDQFRGYAELLVDEGEVPTVRPVLIRNIHERVLAEFVFIDEEGESGLMPVCDPHLLPAGFAARTGMSVQWEMEKVDNDILEEIFTSERGRTIRERTAPTAPEQLQYAEEEIELPDWSSATDGDGTAGAAGAADPPAAEEAATDGLPTVGEAVGRGGEEEEEEREVAASAAPAAEERDVQQLQPEKEEEEAAEVELQGGNVAAAEKKDTAEMQPDAATAVEEVEVAAAAADVAENGEVQQQQPKEDEERKESQQPPEEKEEENDDESALEQPDAAMLTAAAEEVQLQPEEKKDATAAAAAASRGELQPESGEDAAGKEEEMQPVQEDGEEKELEGSHEGEAKLAAPAAASALQQLQPREEKEEEEREAIEMSRGETASPLLQLEQENGGEEIGDRENVPPIVTTGVKGKEAAAPAAITVLQQLQQPATEAAAKEKSSEEKENREEEEEEKERPRPSAPAYRVTADLEYDVQLYMQRAAAAAAAEAARTAADAAAGRLRRPVQPRKSQPKKEKRDTGTQMTPKKRVKKEVEMRNEDQPGAEYGTTREKNRLMDGDVENKREKRSSSIEEILPSKRVRVSPENENGRENRRMTRALDPALDTRALPPSIARAVAAREAAGQRGGGFPRVPAISLRNYREEEDETERLISAGEEIKRITMIETLTELGWMKTHTKHDNYDFISEKNLGQFRDPRRWNSLELQTFTSNFDFHDDLKEYMRETDMDGLNFFDLRLQDILEEFPHLGDKNFDEKVYLVGFIEKIKALIPKTTFAE